MTPQPRMDPVPAWPGTGDIILVSTQAERYTQALTHSLRALMSRFDGGVVITANRPVNVLRQILAEACIETAPLRFVDCISALTGIAPPNESDVIYIDSPTLMEKTCLRAEQLLRRMPTDKRFLFVDSLSTLAVYNGDAAVTEMAHNLTNRMRLLNVGTGLLLVQGHTPNGLRQAIEAQCDQVHET